MRQYQLRNYKIKPGLMTEWVERWLHDIVPARRQQGFDLIGAWTVADSDEFIWLVAAGDSASSFDECEAAYRAARTAHGADGARAQDMNPLDYLAAPPEVREVVPVSMKDPPVDVQIPGLQTD